ncbi:biosynthetic-type acetolactate synthase large subunit [Bacillus sp. Marseille-P3661]|uniref:biosynthetic-type acetolactate synthase large subunit n=1 Tax=Bacillus sp. Marseille-P3661 TaxID=1936234 RepID=UPI000C825F97|nr:biosynthetic-type acetolactate synthase large subunit [Bacillus sp. Marseille-P3661]
MNTSKRNTVYGADLVVRSLESLGYRTIFGCHGETLLPVLDVLNDYPHQRYLQMQHEQAAVHAADGFARASGKPGVALLNTGAGLTNALTGIATAYSDSVPLVIIVAQLNRDKIGKDAFQEVDIAGVTMPIVKHSFKVNSTSDIYEMIMQASTISMEGRRGPVLVEISLDFLTEKVDNPAFFTRKATLPVNAGKPLPLNSIKAARKMIEVARKPVLFIGGGAILSEASDLLRELVQTTEIPVVSSLMGIGAFDGNNPLYLGMVGMHGTFAANKAVHQSDLLICLGVRFSDRVTGKISGFSPKSIKIHVDIDASEINKIIAVDLPIVGDVRSFLESILDTLDVYTVKSNVADWKNETTQWKRTVPRFEHSNSILSPQEVIQMLDHYSSNNTIVVTDVGQHQIFTAHNFKFSKPRTFLSSGGLGTMGYGLPAAIGAAVAMPNHQVICVTGDGSFQMNLQELATAVNNNLSLKIAVLNNGYLGMVRQWQELFYDRRYSSVKIGSPDFAKLAEAYGAKGIKVTSKEQAEQIIPEAIQHQGPVLMEFNVVEEENVYPMVPPGQSNHQVLLSR